MPVAVAYFEVVQFAVIALEDIQFGDVEHDALAVRRRDAPLTALAAVVLRRRSDRRRGRRE